MAHEIEKKIEAMLQQGLSKKTVWSKLKGANDPHKTIFFINNASLPIRRKKYQYINLFLVFILAFITIKKLLVAFSFGAVDFFLLLSLVVPIINIYILREILRFHRLGYQFLFVLSILALFHPENHHVQEITLLLSQAAVAGFLYLRIFPKKEIVTLPRSN